MTLNSNTQRIFCDISSKRYIIQWVLCIFILGVQPKEIWAQNPIENNETNTHPIIRVYQAHISGIDGNRCPMYPHCSQYCAQAIRKHGFGLGWIMACDRLLRCGRDEVQLSPHIRMNGRELIFDPVSANDFWWFSPKATAIENNLPKEKLYHSDPGRMSDLNSDQQK